MQLCILLYKMICLSKRMTSHSSIIESNSIEFLEIYSECLRGQNGSSVTLKDVFSLACDIMSMTAMELDIQRNC